MPKNANACRTSIRRFKSGTGSLHALLDFVQNRIFKKKIGTRSRISVLKLYTHSVNLYTHSVNCTRTEEPVLVPNLGRTEI